MLLISIDTLRQDHLGLYGYPRDTSPFLDQLGARGVVFDDHFANSSTTLPSHASILTGLFTPAHGVRDGGTEDTRTPIPPAAVTLAERFREAEYQTFAQTANPPWLAPAFGFDRGFDEFGTSWRAAPESIDAFLDWLDREDPRRSFTFLHFFDVHSAHQPEPPARPYHSGEEFMRRFAGEPPEGFTGCTHVGPQRCGSHYLKALSEGVEPLPQEHLRYLLGLYDAGIAHLDHRLGQMFEQLEGRGYLENALVVIISDHGESFYEHGQMLHGTHFNEVVRVPFFIVCPPDMDVPPRRIASRTQSVDVAPTILELAGLQPMGQGRSLVDAVLRGEQPEPADVLFQNNVLISQDRQGSFKYEATSEGPRFYDHLRDPEEHEDLLAIAGFAQENSERLMAAYYKLEALLEESLQLREMLGRGETVELSEEETRQLQALGYF